MEKLLPQVHGACTCSAWCTMKRVTAFIVDFFVSFFVFGFLVALLTGAPTTNNEGLAFNLTGPSALIAFVLVMIYFVLGYKIFGVSLGKLLTGTRRKKII